MKKTQAFAVLAVIMVLFAILVVAALGYIFSEKVEYKSSASDSHYPGREYGDYNDKVFDFDDYLKDIGATNVKRYVSTEGKYLINQELRFDLNNQHWILSTMVVEAQDSRNITVSSKIRVECGKVAYYTFAENRGRIVMDNDSPFWMDQDVFDVFHVATNDDVRKAYQVGMDEDPCPFKGLGIAHSEVDIKRGTKVFHDDQGDRTIYDEGSDFLHY